MTAQTLTRRGRMGASLAVAAFAWVGFRAMNSYGFPGFQISSSASIPAQAQKIVDVRVDTTETSPSSAMDVYGACGITAPESGKEADWNGWVTFEGPRVPASTEVDQIPVYAVRLPDGAAICVANKSEYRRELKITVRLPAGVYSIERLGFTTTADGAPPTLVRLSGRSLRSAGSIIKPDWLLPGTAAIFRFTNYTARTNLTYQNIRQDLAALRQGSPQAFRRIMAPLHECFDHIGCATAQSKTEGGEARLKDIHRALLTLAHAQSLARNFKGEGAANAKLAGDLATHLDSLQQSLTELSIGCLSLAPALTVSTPNTSDPLVRKVTISVANAGSSSVSYVRLGASAPSGCRVWPQEEAMFESLRPGETVRAAFTIRLSDASASKSITGTVGYFAQRAPAHMSLQTF